MSRRSPLKRIIRRVKQARADHRERHRPSGFDFAIADRIDQLNPEHWDQVVRDESLFLDRRYLKTVEQFGPHEISPRYALVADAGRPVAVVAAQMVVLSGGQLVGETRSDRQTDSSSSEITRSTSGLRDLGRAAIGRVERRVLVCGNLLSWGPHGIGFAAGEHPQRLWPAVADALYRIRSAERLWGNTDYVMIKDVPDSMLGDSEPLRRFSYRTVTTDPDMVLELPATWRTYNDYLSALNSKYRKTAKAIDADVAAAGLRVEPLRDLSGEADSIHALYLQVHARARVRLATISCDYLPALAAAVGPDRFRCTVIRKGTDLVGFVTTLKDGDIGIGYYVGFDYAANDVAPVYFRLLQCVIADAIALGCRRLSLGRTALEPKARLGAKPVGLHVWMRHRMPLLNLVIRPLLAAIPHGEAPERNVLKEPSAGN